MNEARYREAEGRVWASVGVTPTEQRVRLERTGLTVRVQEVGQGPAGVLVHRASHSGTHVGRGGAPRGRGASPTRWWWTCSTPWGWTAPTWWLPPSAATWPCGRRPPTPTASAAS